MNTAHVEFDVGFRIIGDLNSDGLDELAASASGIAVFWGSTIQSGGSFAAVTADTLIQPVEQCMGLGYSIPGRMDLDLDGVDDLISSVTGYGSSSCPPSAGRGAVLISGSDIGAGGVFQDSVAFGRVIKELGVPGGSGGGIGHLVQNIGDVDGDGFNDLLMGAPQVYGGGVPHDGGTAYILLSSWL